jgi:hypothetical protein
MSFANIESALLTAYTGGSFGLSTAYENVDFSPVDGTAWAMINFLPAQPEPTSIGQDGIDLHTGVFQIALKYPPNTGRSAVVAKADAIAAVFYAGAHLGYNGQYVTISSCGRSGGGLVDGWFTVYLTINWWAHVLR